MTNNFFLRLFVSVLFVGFAALANTGLLDSKGEEYAEDSFKRALIAFGVARALNGVISVAQGTEVAVQPAGIGVNFTPGQILDPINDLVERFSWVMLASSASLGIQKMLLTISAWDYFSYFVFAVFALAALLVWIPPFTRSSFGRYFLKFAVMFVFVRFAVSIIAIGSELIYVEFLQPQYEEAKAKLEATTQDISSINAAAKDELNKNEELSILDKAKRFYDSATRSINIEARIEQYKKAASTASEYAIHLIVIFIVQTIIFPVFFIILLYSLAKNLMGFRYRMLGGERA